MYYWILLGFSLSSCQNNDSSEYKAEWITRKSGKQLYSPAPPLPQDASNPPWVKAKTLYPEFTHHHFRCRGKWGNPFLLTEKDGKKWYLTDCSGIDSHSLPLCEGKEWIYPILIDLLNALQEMSGRRLIITSGHRCPQHHTYIDPKNMDPYSKHMIGAAVDFYFEGATIQPEQLIEWLALFYRSLNDSKESERFTQFERYEKTDTDVITPPWYNKEIFVKYYKEHEGRNGDNMHGKPYFCIQVRWNRLTGQKITYSWKEAHENYYQN